MAYPWGKIKTRSLNTEGCGTRHCQDTISPAVVFHRLHVRLVEDRP